MHNLSSEISESEEEEDDEAWSNVKVPSVCLVCCTSGRISGLGISGPDIRIEAVEDDDGAGRGGGGEEGIGISTIFSGTVISLRCCRNFLSLA